MSAQGLRIRCSLGIFLAGLLASVAAHAQSAGAARAAESRARTVVETIAGGDLDAIWSAMSENLLPSTLERRPEASWRMVLGHVAEDLAGAEVRGIAVDDGEIRVRAGNADRQVVFTFAIEEAPPHRLGGFAAAIDDPEENARGGPALEPGMSREAAVQAIGDFVDQHAAETEFSGTVLVGRDGEAWFESAHGLAHRGYGVANHPNTRFDLGSINKLFTKLAIAQLAAAGKLDLDHTIADHLPDYPNPAVASKVTVRQIAAHTSGLGDIFVPAFMEASKTRFRQPEDFFPLFALEPLLFEPGDGRQYSNAGYQVLGAIVAAASGRPYHEYVAEQIWAPASMKAAAFIARDEPTPDVAVGYTTRTEDGSLRNNLFRLPVIGSPAGSSFSTTGDLLRFDRALRGGELVAPGWVAWVLTGEEPGSGNSPPLDQLGLGFAGGAPGVNSMYEIAGPWTVIVLANQDPPVAGHLARPLARALERLE